MRRSRYIWFIICFALFSAKLLALRDGDSLPGKKLPRHYFNAVVNFDAYSTGTRTLKQDKYVSQRLRDYRVSQVALGFNVPLVTLDFHKKDSTQISNFHLLLAGSYVAVSPHFEGIPDHKLSKTAIGIRAMYNTGKKSIFYAEFAPFTTVDNGYRYTRTYRIATTLVYNCTVNQYFSFRVGYTRSFLFGNRNHLPYIGIRVGRLDGVNLSVQFPRSISFNVPIGRFVKTSIYTKPQGGVYTFANTDTLYYMNNDKRINFGRYEFIGGLRVDVLPSKYFNFYVSGGLSTQNYIGFYSDTYNKRNRGAYTPFYRERLNGTVFLNFGLVFRFGKTRSIYNNYNLYDMQDLNNKDVDNINKGNPQIPARQKKAKARPEEISDLIEVNDLY